jgi:KUP system potassium uptake protein
VIPPYIAHTMINNNIIYEDNIIVSIVKLDTPFGIAGFIKEQIADGLRVFELQIGYMEITPDVEKILRKAQINEKAIFYGIEDIQTDNFFWVIFVFIKKLTPNIIQFYKLPRNKTHGVVTLVKM